MAAFPAVAQDRRAVSPRIHSSGEFVQVLMKLLYTDGITEATDSTEEEYGPARLIDHFLQPTAGVTALSPQSGVSGRERN